MTLIPFDKAVLLSAKRAMSSAKTITITPFIAFKDVTRLLITKLKKNGEVLLP